MGSSTLNRDRDLQAFRVLMEWARSGGGRSYDLSQDATGVSLYVTDDTGAGIISAKTVRGAVQRALPFMRASGFSPSTQPGG